MHSNFNDQKVARTCVTDEGEVDCAASGTWTYRYKLCALYPPYRGTSVRDFGHTLMPTTRASACQSLGCGPVSVSLTTRPGGGSEFPWVCDPPIGMKV